MKRSLKILFLVICLFSFCNVVNAVSEKNLVNIYLFHSYTCKHCKEEIKLLDELEKEYDNIKIYKYEVNEFLRIFDMCIKKLDLGGKHEDN